MRDYEAEERIRMLRRARRREEIRRRRRRRALIKRAVVLSLMCGTIVLAGVLGYRTVKGIAQRFSSDGGSLAGAVSFASSRLTDGYPAVTENSQDMTQASAEAGTKKDYTITGHDAASYITNEEVMSTRALLVDADTQTAVAQKGAAERINPASMTKILTLLVAAEHISDLEDTFTVTREITDYSFSNGCSAAGFDDGETVTVRDLLYGTILPSGGDAAAGLAFYVSGSLEAFVELMNEKLSELGLSDTAHFTNCVGLYDENHYCTLYDMAVILLAAMDNELCREVLSAHIYTTSSTEQHPEGLEISNWFLRRIEDKDTHGEVIGAKTGYVVQSGNCAASYSVSNSGKKYICVTADAHSGWRCIYDQVALYQEYTS